MPDTSDKFVPKVLRMAGTIHFWNKLIGLKEIKYTHTHIYIDLHAILLT